MTKPNHLSFDNVHLRRDNPDVPSDLEQIPSLLNFLAHNGTLGTDHHTALISHTVTGILTAISGLYGDRMGVSVRPYRVLDTAGNISASHPSFVYWAAIDAIDGKPVMLDERGKTAPAPWLAFTRLGCDVGAFSGHGRYPSGMRTVLQSLLVVLAMPSLAVAETFVYFWGSAWEVPAPLVLLVGGLVLTAVGSGLRKWARLKHWSRARRDVGR